MPITFLTNEDKTIIDQNITQLSEDIEERVGVAVNAYLSENPVQATPVDDTLSQEGQAADAAKVGDVTRRLSTTIEAKLVNFERGNIDSVTGNDKDGGYTRVRTDYIFAKSGTTVYTFDAVNVFVYLYDAETKALIGKSNGWNASYVVTDDAYIRLVGRLAGDVEIPEPDNVSHNVVVVENTASGMSLIKRRLLTSGDDLNNVHQCGIYNAKKGLGLPLNMPTSTSGGVIVVYNINSVVIQTVYNNEGPMVHRQSVDGGKTWAAWIVVHDKALISRKTINANYDLNTITDIGIYYYYTSGGIPANAPSVKGGILVVYGVGVALEQVWYGVTEGYCRHKSNANANWTDWVKMYGLDNMGDAKIQQLPVLALTGDVSSMTKDDAVTLNYTLFDQTGTCTCKWQGSSSVRYIKKNYTIKLDVGMDGWAKWAAFVNSQRAANGNISRLPTESRWGAQKKFCTKANWIDPSHMRNIVNARLWGQTVQDRISKGEITDNRTLAPNYGAIDGFPIEITINGESQGLYTLNIPKDGWQFAMANSATEYVVCAESNAEAACAWKALARLDEADYSVEYAADEVSTETIKTSFNVAIQAALDAGADWETTLAPYVDINSVFDYFIFACCLNHRDGIAHNALYGTYDGTKWFMSAYDLDTTYGSDPYGTSWFAVGNNDMLFAGVAQKHRLAQLMYMHSKAKLAARFKELRAGVLSDRNVWHTLSQFAVDIATRNYDVDREIWPTMPGTSTANMAQYLNFYRMHCECLDKEVESWNV